LRVMVPYWLITILVVLLDGYLLGKTYTLQDLGLTWIGINISKPIRHLDFVRWYVTMLLAWYVLFYVAISKIRESRRLLFLLCCAGVMFIVDYYLTHMGWYQIFAFPLGYGVSQYLEKGSTLYTLGTHVFACGLLMIAIGIFYKLYLSIEIERTIPSLFYKGVCEVNSILLCIGLLLLVASAGNRNLYSPFLLFCGSISYELFLLHGAFLIKYNPVQFHNELFLLPVDFLLYLMGILVVAYGAKKGIGRVTRVLYRNLLPAR